MGQKICLFIALKRSVLQSWKRNPRQPIVNSYRKKYANPFEIDEGDIALAVPEFLLVNLDNDDDKQNKIDILIEYYFAFWFGWNLKIKDIVLLQIFVFVICTEQNSISTHAKKLPLPNKGPGVRVENLNKHPGKLFGHLC